MIEDAGDVCSVLAPVTFTDSMITSVKANGVNLPEDPNSAWSSATTYAAGDRVYLLSTHRVYESAKAGNQNKDPSVITNQYTATGAPNWWIDVGPTNRYAAFDSQVSTPTTGASVLEFVLRPGAHNGIALLGLDADSIEIIDKASPGGDLIYNYAAPLEGSMPADYYEYFFDRFKPQTQLIATGIAPYGDSELTIRLTKATGNASVGMIAVGDMRPLGVPQRGVSVEPFSYAVIVTDAFGNTSIRRRAKATGMRISAKMDIEDANSVVATVQELLDVPVVVVGSTALMYEALTVFGLISASIQYDDFEMPTLNATVKGLI